MATSCLEFLRIIYYRRTHTQREIFFPSSSALWFLIADLLIINNKQELSTRRIWYVFNACPLYQLRWKNNYCALIDAATAAAVAASVTVYVMPTLFDYLSFSISFSRLLLLWPQKPQIITFEAIWNEMKWIRIPKREQKEETTSSTHMQTHTQTGINMWTRVLVYTLTQRLDCGTLCGEHKVTHRKPITTLSNFMLSHKIEIRANHSVCWVNRACNTYTYMHAQT